METLFYNGEIISMEGGAAPEAVLLREKRIAAVGSLDKVKMEAGNPIMVNLKGKCLMPAFIDPHSHILMNGQMSNFAQLGSCQSHHDIIEVLKKYIERHDINENGVIFGFGYDHNFLLEGCPPDKFVLDQVSTTIPILILHVSAHLASVNSKALELAGITAETPDPEGGIIGRIKGTLEPSGYLEEAGMSMVQEALSERMEINFESIISGMQEAYIQNGITTAQDGVTTESEFNTLKIISNMGGLKIDVVSYPLMTGGGMDILHQNQDLCRKYKNRLKIGGYKLVLDGSPQGRTAWMTEPYCGGDPGYCGYPWMQTDAVERFIKIAVEEGQQLLAHCNGDAASEQYLNAYEKAIREIGCYEDLRPVMIHCQTVRNDQLERMAKINMIASMFIGHVYYWGDIHRKNLGYARGEHISPTRDALDRNVRITFHQDTPVTPPNMLHSIWCAVNRISRGGHLIGADQRISVYDALKAVTIDAAYGYFEEDQKGSIKAGKLADLVILDRSPLSIDPKDIRNITVLRTIKEGVTIYNAT